MNLKMFQRSARQFILPFIAMMIGILSACQGPEQVPQKKAHQVPNSDEYNFDIFLLAEWAGYLNPVSEKIDFSIQVDGERITHADRPEISMNSILSFDESGSLIFTPYNTHPEISFSCVKTDNEAEKRSGNYQCSIRQTGAQALNQIWNSVLATDRPAIRIGSGDNFGASQPISTSFGDYPAVHILNQFNLTADTFGNHSFDFTLDNLQSLIDAAEYPFVISNLYNIPNNLEYISTYEIVSIPSSDSSKSDLPVAIIGAIDDQIMEILQRGSLGSLDVTNYCALIHTMEEAYNRNARAFILLSHVTTESINYRQFFNAMFSLNRQFAGMLPDDSEYPCRSRLNVTQDMLDAYHQVVPNATADDLRYQIREDILNSIALVMGENSLDPILTPVIPAYEKELAPCPEDNAHLTSCPEDLEYLSYSVDGCIPGKSSIVNLFPMFSSTSRLTDACTTDEHDIALNSTSLRSYHLKNLERKDAQHPLWLAEIPHYGLYTARAGIKAVPSDPIPGISGRYHIEMTDFVLLPVLDNKPETEYTKSSCTETLSHIEIPQSCQEFYQNSLKYVRDSYTATLAENAPKIKRPSSHECQTDMISLNVSDDKYSLDDLLDVWNCLYTSTKLQWSKTCDLPDKYTDKNDAECYEKAVICSLNDYQIAAEKKDDDIRQYSTFIVNMITSFMLQYARDYAGDSSKFSPATPAPDILIMNAGNIRESLSFDAIDSALLAIASPYGNQITSTPLSIEKVVELLEFGLKTGKGGFPAIAGFVFSYEIIDDQKSVREIWKTDSKQNLSQLMYLSEKIQNEIRDNDTPVCILNLTDNGECLIGSYSYTKGIKAALEPCHTPFGCFSPSPTELLEFPYMQVDKSLHVLMTNYMYKGGDNYSTVLGDTTNISAPTSYAKDSDIVEEFLSKSNSGECTYLVDEETFTADDILKLNLRKRIYALFDIDEGHTDRSDAICVPTQKKLAESLEVYDFCHYE